MAPGITQSAIGNNDLKWKTTYQYNAGLDLGLLDNRLTFMADVYRKHTKDLLLVVDIPLSTGAEDRRILQNVGSIQNQGIELGLTTNNMQPLQGFGWTTNLNFTMNRNKGLDLGQSVNNEGQMADRRLESGNGFVLTGQPLGVFYAYKVQGIFQSPAEIDAAAKQSPGKTAGGDIRFCDLDGDGIINDKDRTVIGSPNPKLIADVTNTFTFKNLGMSIFFQSSFGNDIYNQNRETLESMRDPLNQTTRVLNRWTPTNPNTDVPRAIAADPNGNARYSNRFIEDGT